MKTKFLIAALLLATPSISSAATLGFDTLGGSSAVPNGYGGLDWSNWYVRPAASSLGGPSGYNNADVSAPDIAYNANGTPASFSAASGTFTLNSFYLTAAWDNNLNVTLTGSRNGVVLDTASFTVSSSAPTFESFNWLGIDTVKLSTSGGVNAFSGGSGTEVALDNLTINNAVSSVPEMSTWAMMLAGFAFVGLMRGCRARPATRLA